MTAASASKRHARSTSGKAGAGAAVPCARAGDGATSNSARMGSVSDRRIGAILARTGGNRRTGIRVHAAMTRTFPSIFLLTLFLAACAVPGGSGAGSPDGSPSAPAPDGDDIPHPGGEEPILVVEDVGGFAMVQMLAT